MVEKRIHFEKGFISSKCMTDIHNALSEESDRLVNILYKSYPDYMRSYKPTRHPSYDIFYQYVYGMINKHNNVPFRVTLSRQYISPYKQLMKSVYTPPILTNFVQTQVRYQYVTNVVLNGINVTIIISRDTELDEVTLMRRMRRYVTCASFCFESKSERVDGNVTIYIYDNPIPKNIYQYGKTLGPENVNSGISHVDGGNVSIIFRGQESLKVFIHEILHLTGNGPHRMKKGMDKKMAKLIPVDSSVCGEEIYVEMVARLVNSGMLAYENCGGSYDMFRTLFDKCIYIETLFAVCQTRKILNHMGIGSFKLESETLSSYKEDTNVFSYYIACASLFTSNEFIPWLVSECDGIKFTLSCKALNSYMGILDRSLNNDKFSRFCDMVHPDTNFGMRMSIIELK